MARKAQLPSLGCHRGVNPYIAMGLGQVALGNVRLHDIVDIA